MEPSHIPAASSQAETATTVLKKLMTTAEIPSFKALCRTAGVSEWAIQQVRRDRIPHMRVQTLQKLATALQLSLDELLTHFGAVEKSAVPASSQVTNQRDRIVALEAEYKRLQTHHEQQETVMRQRFQQEVLSILEPWLLQWPTVSHAVAKNPDLPAARLVPLVQPVQNLLDQWGIEAIAPVGSEVPYDPQRHLLMNGIAQPGDPVRIRYTGFMQGDTLLHRAKVSPIE